MKTYEVLEYAGLAYHDTARSRYIVGDNDLNGWVEAADELYSGPSLDEARRVLAGVHELPSWKCTRQEHEGAPPTWDFGIWRLVEYDEDGSGDTLEERDSLTDEARSEMEREARLWY